MCGSKLPLPARIATDVFTGGAGEVLGAAGAGAKPPGAPNLPQFPGLTKEEKDILDKQGLSLQQFNDLISGSSTTLAQNKQVLQQISGLYDAQGNLNQAALADLKSRTQGQLAQAQAVGTSALGYLQNYFGGGSSGGGSATPGGDTSGVVGAQSAAYKRALEGTGAINEATKQQQMRDFIALKDSAAQRGIMIEGDTPATAISSSTAGQRMIELFKNNVAAQNSQERLGYISTLGGQVGGSVNAAQNAAGYGSAATAAQLGYVGQAGTQSLTTLAPYLQAYQQGLSLMAQPYEQQRIGQYNAAVGQTQMNYGADLARYNAQQQQLMGWLQLGGQLGSAAITGAPMRTAMPYSASAPRPLTSQWEGAV